MIPDPATPRSTPRRVEDCSEHGAVRSGDDGHDAERRPDGAGGRGVRLARQDVRDPAPTAPSASWTGTARRCWSTTSSVGDIWRMCQTKDAPIRDWVQLAVDPRPRTGARRCSGSTRLAPTTRKLFEKVNADAATSTTPTAWRSRSSTPEAATAFSLERTRGGAGHDLRHGQRAARLPHRPVPDPRARDERQDALDRAADRRRRAVRDRRRRLGAQARAAVRQGEPSALGLARRIPARWCPSLRAARRRRPATRARSCSPTRSTARSAAARGGPLAGRKVGRARQPRQPLLPGAVLGAGARRRRPTTPSSPRASRRWRSGWPPTRSRSSRS